MILQTVILAGGLSTRLGSLTVDRPKSLVPILGRPFIDWQFELLIQQGVKDIVMCLGHMGESIQHHVERKYSHALNLKFSFDGEKRLGTGGAIRNASHLLDDNFSVIFGDSYLSVNHFMHASRFLESNFKAMMLFTKHYRDFDQPNVSILDGFTIKYDKSLLNSDMKYIDFGLSFFSKKVFLDYSQKEESFDLNSLLTHLSSKLELRGVEVNEEFYEVGSLKGIVDFEKFLQSR